MLIASHNRQSRKLRNPGLPFLCPEEASRRSQTGPLRRRFRESKRVVRSLNQGRFCGARTPPIKKKGIGRWRASDSPRSALRSLPHAKIALPKPFGFGSHILLRGPVWLRRLASSGRCSGSPGYRSFLLSVRRRKVQYKDNRSACGIRKGVSPCEGDLATARLHGAL